MILLSGIADSNLVESPPPKSFSHSFQITITHVIYHINMGNTMRRRTYNLLS